VNDDRTTLNVIRNFLGSDKPARITPLDISIMVSLMVSKAEDHDVTHSQLTLAKMFNSDIRTVARSQARLAGPGVHWISRCRRRGKTSLTTINFQNVPAEEILRLRITDDAKALAVRYQIGLIKFGRRKFPKHWLAQQTLSAQRIIDSCGGDVERAAVLIAFAMNSREHCKRAKQSLYHLYGRWPKILKTWNETSRNAAMEITNDN
jgi:hypothetical protein